jgi:quercetin dioxygenase-like cupin family protein/NAD-dependent dihydropyrimidine dehydrogenase PreA subunit
VDRWLPHIDLQRCTGCGDCIPRCPTQALGWADGKAAILRPDACIYSGTCETVSPVGAVELVYVIRSAGHVPMSDYAYIANLIDALPDIPADTIVSRTLHSGDDVKAVLFGFAIGQELSEHTASMPATLIFLQGEADLQLGEDCMSAQAGTWVHMPPNLPHSIVAKTPVVLLLLLRR